MNQRNILYWAWVLVSIFLTISLIYFSSNNPEKIKERDLKNISRLIDAFGDNLKKVNLMAPEGIRRGDIEKYYKNYLTKELLNEWKENPEKALGRITSSPWPEKIEINSLSFSNNEAIVEGEIIEMTSLGESGRTKITLNLVLKDRWLREWLISDVKILEREEISLANPAAVFCQNQGYRYEIRQDPEGGQYGVCIFDENNECEEWSFYRKECGIEYLKENQDNQNCAKEGERVNRNPLLGSTDKKCCEGLVEERVSRSYSICKKIEEPFSEGPSCINLCGDGICQEVVCLAIGCPCPETPENCPQDCK